MPRWPATSPHGGPRRSRRRRRASPGGSWHELPRPAGTGRKACCGRRGKLAGRAIPLGLDPAPQVLLHPSVIERFTAHAPGLSGPARRTLRTNLRFIARRVVPHLDPADAPLPRERARAPYTPAEIAGFLALAGAQPTSARAMRAAALVCLGAGAGLIRPAQRARHRHLPPVRRRHRDRPGRPVAAGGAGAGPLPRPPACRGGLRRRAPGHRRHRPRTAQHQQPADPVTGRRRRAAGAGHFPAARHLAGRRRAADRPGHVHARRRDQLQPAAGRHRRRLDPGGEQRAVALLGGQR